MDTTASSFTLRKNAKRAAEAMIRKGTRWTRRGGGEAYLVSRVRRCLRKCESSIWTLGER
jgi:hypothetical protein